MKIDLTMDEILEDLCGPGRPPGRWGVPQGPGSAWSAFGDTARSRPVNSDLGATPVRVVEDHGG